MNAPCKKISQRRKSHNFRLTNRATKCRETSSSYFYFFYKVNLTLVLVSHAHRNARVHEKVSSLKLPNSYKLWTPTQHIIFICNSFALNLPKFFCPISVWASTKLIQVSFPLRQLVAECYIISILNISVLRNFWLQNLLPTTQTVVVQ